MADRPTHDWSGYNYWDNMRRMLTNDVRLRTADSAPLSSCPGVGFLSLLSPLGIRSAGSHLYRPRGSYITQI
jgi:hypothetical protein